MINNRHPRIHHDVRLSLFVLAEVIDNVPSPHYNAGPASPLQVKGIWSCPLWLWGMVAMTMTVGESFEDVLGSLKTTFCNLSVVARIFHTVLGSIYAVLWRTSLTKVGAS